MLNKKNNVLAVSSNAALTIKIAIIAFATLVIYHQDFLEIANEAIKSDLMSHILAIPFIFAYLVYRKRKMLKATIPFKESKPMRVRAGIVHLHEVVGALLCLLAILIYWHGSYTFYPLEYHIASLPLFVAGIVLIIFNTQTLRTLAFPIAFLLFLVPPPIQAVYMAGTTLATFNSEVVYAILKTIGVPVSLTMEYGAPVILLESSEIAAPSFAVDIACAGIYSLIGFTIFAVFFTYVARGTIPKKVLIFFIGFPLICTLNIIRITTIVLIAAQFGVEAAMGAFHLFGGWVLIFLGTLILLPLSEKLLKIQILTTRFKTKPCSHCEENARQKKIFCLVCGKLLKYPNFKLSKRDIGKIVGVLASVSLIMLFQVPLLALTKGPEGVVLTSGEQIGTQILPEIPGYDLQFIERNIEFEEISGQDASLLYAYVPTNSSESTVWVTFEIGSTLSSVHRPEISWIRWAQITGRQPKAIQLDLRDIHLLENPPITARFFAFKHTESNETQVMLYWYEQVIFETDSSLEQKYVKISTIAIDNDPSNFAEIEDMLLPFGETIANYWQPIKTWSKITTAIVQHGTILIAATATTLIIILVFQQIQNYKQKKSNFLAFQKLALPEEKTILQATHQTSQKNLPTGNAIARSYQKLTQEPIKLDKLIQKLHEAEEAGFIKKEIASLEDNPTLIWKTTISVPNLKERPKT